MSRKRANVECIDADDMMICVDHSIKCRNGGAYEMADVKEYSSSIAQENDNGPSPKRAIVSCNFVNYRFVNYISKDIKYFFKIKG